MRGPARMGLGAMVAGLLAGLVLAGVAVAGPNLPPAPYKPLPVGTKLDYGWWKCTVEASDGFETVCSDGKRRAQFFGKFIVHGEQDKDGYGGETSEAPVSGFRIQELQISQISMTSDARRAMRNLWPLVVGKRARFVLKYGSDSEDRIEVSIEAGLFNAHYFV